MTRDVVFIEELLDRVENMIRNMEERDELSHELAIVMELADQMKEELKNIQNET